MSSKWVAPFIAALACSATGIAAQPPAAEAGQVREGAAEGTEIASPDTTPVVDAPPPAPPVRHVADDHELTLMVLTEVDGNRAQAGDKVKLRVHEPLTADGFVLIDRGAPAVGEVLTTDKSGLALERGKMAVRLTELVVEGRRLALDEEISVRGKGGKMDDALKIVLVPIYALFAPGNSAKLKAGELVTASVGAGLCYSVAAAGERAKLVDCPEA